MSINSDALAELELYVNQKSVEFSTFVDSLREKYGLSHEEMVALLHIVKNFDTTFPSDIKQ